MHDHHYTKQIDVEKRLVYGTTHDNGDRTEVCAERVADGDEEGHDWHVYAVDYDSEGGELAQTTVGYASERDYAENRLQEWLRANPKGVKPGGGGLGGMLSGLGGGA